MDHSILKVLLENHVLKNRVVLGQLYNGQRLETIAGKFLRVFIYRTVGPSSQSLVNPYASPYLPTMHLSLPVSDAQSSPPFPAHP